MADSAAVDFQSYINAHANHSKNIMKGVEAILTQTNIRQLQQHHQVS